MKTETLYDILQVIPTAEQEVIDAAYRRLCKKYHPDVNRDAEAGRRMNLFNEAYAVLRNPERREPYDRKLNEERAVGMVRLEGREAKLRSDEYASSLEEGRQVLLSYFLALREQVWHKAYALLCRADRTRIPLQAFLEWQEAVAGLFELGEVDVALHRSHRLSGRLESAEYVVEGREVDLAADKWHDFVSVKHLVLEVDSGDPAGSRSWRIRLGYEDVRDLATRFRLMAQSLHPRVLDEAQLLQLAEQEAYRSRRFRYPFSLAAFQVLPMQPVDAYVHLWEARKLNWVSRTMDALRLSDVLAWTESGDGMLILPHTDLQQAHVALQKLTEQLMDHAAREGAEVMVVWCASEYDGSPVHEWRGRLGRSLHAKLRGAIRNS